MGDPLEADMVQPPLTLPGAFAEQVRRHPGRPAVIDGGRVLTYQELSDQSRRVARVLRGGGTSDDAVVAILAAHGADLILAILSVLEAGKTVVVLDPADPAARWRELLAEAGSRMVLADAVHAAQAEALAPASTQVVRLEAALAGAPPLPDTGGGPAPDTIAFLLFTSGSTGRPKGVMATHANMVLNVRNYALSAGLGPEDRLTLLSRAPFMAGLSAIFGALLNGAALLPFDIRSRGFRDLHHWLLAERITLYHSVPTLFRRFCESLAPDVRFPSVRIVKLGGEPVMRHDVKLWQRHFPASSELINGLGLSEANGNLCHHRIRHDAAADDGVVPVGRPLPGVEIVVLDDEGAVVADGVVGEIAFRCAHRSPGYWRSEEWAARLICVPSGGAGEPFFRTGDLGRLRPDGGLEHLGRKDDQLKLRGLRIEPAQVEAALLEDPRIRQCAVSLRGQGSRPQQLVAWFVPAPGPAPTPDDLRAQLGLRLSPALIPSVFAAVPEMPVTPGGKIDRKALPDPFGMGAAPGAGNEAPRDAVELALVRLWRKLLRVRYVRPADDFFALGGDSLTAAVLLSKVEETFDAHLELGAFLATPSLRGLAGLIRNATVDGVHRRLVLARPGGERTPFFYVPGAGAAGRLPAPAGPAGPRPHYVLNYRGLDGVERPQRTIPEMAAFFLEEVRKVQPAGPYLLGGGSFGALVALEAAHRLLDDGEEVSLLVVEDSLLDGCLRPRKALPWRHRIERSLLWLMPVGKRFQLTWAGVRAGLRQWRFRVLVPVARWRSRLQEKPLPTIDRFHDLLNHCLAAKRGHEPRPYPGPVVLLRTRFTAAQRLFELEPTLGWSRVSSDLQTIDLEGEKGDRDTIPVRQAAYLDSLEVALAAAEKP